MRKKAKRDATYIDATDVVPLTSTGEIGFKTPLRRKSAAQYQREYRERKKAELKSRRVAKFATTNEGSTENVNGNSHNTSKK